MRYPGPGSELRGSITTIVDWCLPVVLQCERPIKEITKLYIEGDEKKGLKKHLIPVYQN